MPNRIERSASLPLDLFTDQAIFEVELADIWHTDWVFACTVDAVADPGEFALATIGRQSVLVVRGDDYQLRAFANVCSHRGSPLVENGGRASRFSCPYHAWTYDLQGALTSVPYAVPDEIDRSRHGLASYRIEQWQGLVFVSLNADVEPLSERLAVVEPYIKPLGLTRLHHDVEGVATETWRANWKAVYSNAIDSYSQFRVHAETIEPVSPTDGSYYLAGSARATVTGGESNARADHLVLAIPPSFVAVIYPDALLWQAFTPRAVDETGITIGFAAETPLRDGHTSQVSLPGWDAAFIDEDREMSERLQANAGARFTPGPLLELEQALGDFHDYLSWKLSGSEPDPPYIAAGPGDRPEPTQ